MLKLFMRKLRHLDADLTCLWFRALTSLDDFMTDRQKRK